VAYLVGQGDEVPAGHFSDLIFDVAKEGGEGGARSIARDHFGRVERVFRATMAEQQGSSSVRGWQDHNEGADHCMAARDFDTRFTETSCAWLRCQRAEI
jgi:hypothetical protein